MATILAVLLIVGAGAFGIWKLFFSQPKLPENVVALSGRIEGDDSAVSPRTGGRILEIRYREGDVVNAGDVIATLDDQQVRAREEQAQAAVLQSEAQLHSAQAQIPVLQEQLQQAQLQTEQAKTDADARVRQAEAELSASEAELAQQEASLKLADFDRDAYTRLAKTGAVSERQGKQAVSAAETQQAVVVAARRRVEASRASINVAKANLANPGIRSAQSAGVRKQMLQQQSQISNAAADVQHARAQLAEARANRQDLTVRAPFHGTIVTRTAEPGEVVQAGTPVVTLLDLTKVYLRGFVPEGQIGKVKVSQRARVYLDSNPAKPVEAEVSRIDPQATFTPENTYFRDDRVKQVVGVKLQLKGALGYAKPGMPADGEILVQGDRWPERRTHR
ncbi:MAG: HlyD family efflux transporter periplasmic adaptor subunit [Acidobacteriota bacterium]|nr:HlyD family efflux transporter periplasmic adaptor subunit [Acidobacteriota bacterium]